MLTISINFSILKLGKLMRNVITTTIARNLKPLLDMFLSAVSAEFANTALPNRVRAANRKASQDLQIL